MQHPVATVLLALAGAGCALQIFATARLARFLRGRAPVPGDGIPPVTFWRALKPSVPDLRSKLDALAASARPGDQLLLGVDAGLPDVAICRAWSEAHPGRDI